MRTKADVRRSFWIYGFTALVKQMWESHCSDAEGSRAKLLVLLGYVMEDDEWRRAFDEPSSPARVIWWSNSSPGEPPAQLRDSAFLRLISQCDQARRFMPAGFSLCALCELLSWEQSIDRELQQLFVWASARSSSGSFQIRPFHAIACPRRAPKGACGCAHSFHQPYHPASFHSIKRMDDFGLIEYG
jgi:hypothetical protein